MVFVWWNNFLSFHFFSNITCNLFRVGSNFPDLPGWTNPKTAEVQVVLSKIFLLINTHLQVFESTLIDIDDFSTIPIESNGPNDDVKFLFLSIREKNCFALNTIKSTKDFDMALLDMLERTYIQHRNFSLLSNGLKWPKL